MISAPHAVERRSGSPPADSTLTTSAPASAKSFPAYGPAMSVATSRTRSCAKGGVIPQRYLTVPLSSVVPNLFRGGHGPTTRGQRLPPGNVALVGEPAHMRDHVDVGSLGAQRTSRALLPRADLVRVERVVL